MSRLVDVCFSTYYTQIYRDNYRISSVHVCDILLARAQSEFLMCLVCLHECNHSHARETGNEKV